MRNIIIANMRTKKPLVSVIVTTKNEADVLERLLLSIKNQTYKNTEIIVVDNNSDDGTYDIAKRYTKFTYQKGPQRSAQRNFGARKSHGKYLLILDADMKLTESVIQECVKLSENDKKIGAVVIPEESIASNFWEKTKAFERSFYNLEGDLTTDSARFFPKKIFELAKGYDENLTGPEDWDLPESISELGYKQSRIRSKIYHYERIKSLSSLVKKKYLYALSSHRYVKKRKFSIFSPKTIYFLRPVFYKNWRMLYKNPILSFGMMCMLTLELVYGGLGYIIGKYRKL